MTNAVVEIGIFKILPGHEADFAAAYQSAKHNIAVSDGCRGLRMTQGVETPTTFVLIVEWESIALHQAFRDSERYPAWRGPISPHFAEPPFVEHYVALD